eukprot:CAMPEP_0172490490 /NCGR_PEP_ID=MMETSP1066-20121228/20920_1 /TAXON_ID=671091 /ORGANISM="Coscinodiscus wailesii, Strain CCMP2513" /LENGTH=145 /DNA_ID=CAMNT_0013258973 /DNA_START=53 /DNA_END=490 /DNA_ORIENTATION=+
MAELEYNTFNDALSVAYKLFEECPDSDVRRWFREKHDWQVQFQTDVGHNRRRDLVSGFHGRVGADGQKRNLMLRLDWDPNIFSHINVKTVDKQGHEVNHHLTFRNEIDKANQSDSQVFDLMQRLTAFNNQGMPIAEAFDRIRSAF